MDLVVVTIPQGKARTARHPPRPLPDGAVVVDTGNYYPQQRDGRIDAIEDGTPETVWTAQHLEPPRAPAVVKAFTGSWPSTS